MAKRKPKSMMYYQDKCDGTLYVKVGSKYVHVSDPWAYNGLREGHWQVWVRKGQTTIRTPIWPARDEVGAAMLEAEEAMIKALAEADKMRPPVIKMSKRHQKAWARYVKEAGEEAFRTFSHGSLFDIVQAGIKALKERAYGDGQ
jgi:hypothetical protein